MFHFLIGRIAIRVVQHFGNKFKYEGRMDTMLLPFDAEM